MKKLNILFILALLSIPLISAAENGQAPFLQSDEIMEVKDGWQYYIPEEGNENFPSGSAEWKPIKAPNNPSDRKGAEIIWFRIKALGIPDNYDHLHLSPVDTSIRIFIDGRQFYQYGFNQNRQAVFKGWPFHIIRMPENFKDKWIYFQLYSKYRDIGFYETYFGTQSSIINNILKRDSFKMFVVLLMFLTGLIPLLFSLHRRTDFIFLSFSLFTVSVAVSFVTDLWMTKLFWNPQVILLWTNTVSLYLIPLFLNCFFIQVFMKDRKKKILLFLIIFWILNTVVTLIAGIIDMMNIFRLSLLYQIPLILNLLILFGYALFYSIKNKYIEAVLFSSGFFAVITMTTIDIIGVFPGVHQYLSFRYLGMFLFILSLYLIIYYRFYQAQIFLENYSAVLETKVQERTVLLEQANVDLNIRNDLFKSELNLARQLQQQMIPASNQLPENTAALYHPLYEVGGDYYDIFLFDSQSRDLSFIICDVSGHGVSAAFLTAIIKSVSLRNRSSADNPAEILMKINDAVSRFTGNYFATAFAGYIDRKNQTLYYSNAGHPSPYLLSDQTGISQVRKTAKTFPLGIKSNDELNKIGKVYINDSVKIQKNDQLFCFTDGLTETLKYQSETECFEDILEDRMSEISFDSPDQFISSIYQKLKDYHGSELFEDDICMFMIKV